MNLTLQQLFGVNASQNSQTLTIKKADLPLLTPNIRNSAESLLAAIILQALENFQGNLTDPSGNKITDPQWQTIDYNNSILYEFLLIEPWNSFLKEKNGSLWITDTLIIHKFANADTELS